MPVSAVYREWVLEQLGRVAPVTARAMFGGVGLYSDGLFFALIEDDTLFLKVDDTTRADFEAVGSRPFRPYGDHSYAMGYLELPADLLEAPDALRPWIQNAIGVARRKKRR